MRAFFLFVLIFVLYSPVFAENPFSHALFDRVLQAHVNAEGLVDYSALKRDPSDLRAYVHLLGQYSPENAPEFFSTQHHRLAYWINAYNALALLAVVEAYPVKSVRDIKWFYGFFNRTNHIVGGRTYTLKHIEHEIIRKRFTEPRIHAALNCASMGCPKLHRDAYQAHNLEASLERDMRIFVREKRNVQIDREKQKLYLSHIFREFEEDFTNWFAQHYDRSDATILDYLSLYLSREDTTYLSKHPNIDIKHIKYDWRLNDQILSR